MYLRNQILAHDFTRRTPIALKIVMTRQLHKQNVTLEISASPLDTLCTMSAIDVPPDHPPNEPQTVTEDIVEGQVDTTETNMRYLAYANRFRTIALASSRYLAYTSGTSVSTH